MIAAQTLRRITDRIGVFKNECLDASTIQSIEAIEATTPFRKLIYTFKNSR
jgi:hypothetical protein